MNSLSATFVRTSLVSLVIGFLLGAWMLVASAYNLPVLTGMRLMHIHFLTVGFFTCMVMGVALWMFPAPPGLSRTGIAKMEPWGWSAYYLLVAGLALRAVVTFVPGSLQTELGRLATLGSALTQVGGAICFGTAVWQRTKARQQPAPLPAKPGAHSQP